MTPDKSTSLLTFPYSATERIKLLLETIVY